MAKKRRRPPKRKTRRQLPKSRTKSRSDWGYYLLQDFGVSAAYVGNVNEDESVEAALFGVDTWRDGLIVCWGRRFETKEAFEEAMQARSDAIKPSTKARCRGEIAYGLRIRRTAKADLPPEFGQWRHLVDPLEDVHLPSHLYRCPECGRGLSEPFIEQILQGVDGQMMFYFLCTRCNSSRHRTKGAEYFTVKHMELIGAIEEIDGFSVTWDQDNMPMFTEMSIGSQYGEAVKMMIAEDKVQAACMAIECHIAYASVPNRIVQDRHVLSALQAVVDGELLIEDEDDDLDCVVFLVEAIKDGIGMFSKAMRFRGSAEPHVSSALQKIMDSVKNHHKGNNPRSYIQFVNRFIKV